jgi:hypothetical protein
VVFEESSALVYRLCLNDPLATVCGIRGAIERLRL